jgi:sulfotransferase
MKKYYFLVSLPRSGNTMLGAILNQNKKISVTANSIVPSLMWNLEETFNNSLNFKNFPDHKSRNDLMSNIIDSYYSSWNSEIIIDRSAWGTPNNLNLLKKYCPNKPKFIILVRDVEEVLASFIKWSIENPKNFIDYETKNASIEEKCDFLMRPDLQIVQEYSSIYNILKNEDKDDYLLVDYKDLVSNPNSEIKKIYKFLGMTDFDHNLEFIDQFSSNGTLYEDSVVGDNLHKIKTNGVYKSNYSVKDYLPESVIQKYSNLNFWKEYAI